LNGFKVKNFIAFVNEKELVEKEENSYLMSNKV